MKAKISEICKINENSLSKSDNYEFINYLDTSNLTEGSIDEVQTLHMEVDKIPSRAKRKIKKKDILISTVRPNQKHYGIINNMIDNLIASTGFAVLSANEKIVDPEYLYHYLIQENITNYLQAIAEASTSTYPSIKPSVIGELEVELPPLPEQKAVAHMLSTINEKIEVNNQINKTLENMAQVIFKNWFVDFEFPDENGNPYKSSGGKMIESELGKIPESWNVTSLYDVSDIVYGAPFSSEKFNVTGEGLPLIRIRDLKTGTPSFYTEEEHNKATIIKKGQILIGMDGEFTPTIWSGREGYLNQRVCLLKSNKEYIHDLFLYELIKPHMRFFESANVGTTVIHIGKKDFDSIRVIYPKKNTLSQFYSVVDPIHKKIINNTNETDNLNNMRNILLPKLLSGKIELPAEEEVCQ